jgi:hypothetical protein
MVSVKSNLFFAAVKDVWFFGLRLNSRIVYATPVQAVA